MLLEELNGVGQVTVADGTALSKADLPPTNTSRWVASRKALVARAVDQGLLTVDEALARYQLSEEEFAHWLQAVREHGVGALKIRALQKYRQL